MVGHAGIVIPNRPGIEFPLTIGTVIVKKLTEPAPVQIAEHLFDQILFDPGFFIDPLPIVFPCNRIHSVFRGNGILHRLTDLPDRIVGNGGAANPQSGIPVQLCFHIGAPLFKKPIFQIPADQELDISLQINPLGMHLIPLAQQIQPRIAPVEIQIHPPALGRIGHPPFQCEIHDDLVSQIGRIIGVGQQNPVLCQSHIQKICRSRQLQAVGLLLPWPIPGKLSAAVDGLQLSVPEGSAMTVIQPHGSQLPVVLGGVNIIHGARSHVYVHGRHIAGLDKPKFPALPIPGQVIRSVQRESFAAHAVGQQHTVEVNVPAVLRNAERRPVKAGIAGQKDIIFLRLRLPAGNFFGLSRLRRGQHREQDFRRLFQGCVCLLFIRSLHHRGRHKHRRKNCRKRQYCPFSQSHTVPFAFSKNKNTAPPEGSREVRLSG